MSPVTCPRCKGRGNVTHDERDPLTRQPTGVSRTAPCRLCGGTGETSWPTSTQPVARRTDPSTSHAAAASVRDLRKSQAAVLYVLATHGGMTDDELQRRYAAMPQLPRQSESGVRTRRRELVDAGLVRDTGRKAPLASGRMAIVWEAASTPTTPGGPA